MVNGIKWEFDGCKSGIASPRAVVLSEAKHLALDFGLKLLYDRTGNHTERD